MTDSIAKALILAIQYISTRPTERDTLDDNCKMLEGAAYYIRHATPAEKEMLIRVASELGLPEWPKQIGIIDDEEDD